MSKIITVVINFIGIISTLLAIKDWIVPQIRQGNIALGSTMIIIVSVILIMLIFRKKMFLNYIYRLFSFNFSKISRPYILENRETI